MNRIFKIHPSECSSIMGNAKVKGELSTGCITYLKKWYANDEREPIRSKYIDKGNFVENDVINMAIDVLGFGLGEKNIITKENDYMIGTCDVDLELEDTIIDTKGSWCNETLQNSALELDKDYEWQLRCYMALYNRSKAILFYGLVDTPAEVNFGLEVSFEHIPLNKRWVAYQFNRDLEIEQQIYDKVKKCREWLAEHDKQINNNLGKLIIK